MNHGRETRHADYRCLVGHWCTNGKGRCQRGVSPGPRGPLGRQTGRTTIPGSMYSATKWAVSAIGYGVREELRGAGIRVTLIEPGMVDTPFFDEPPAHALKPEDIANAVMYAVAQPAHVDVNEILVRPTPASE